MEEFNRNIASVSDAEMMEGTYHMFVFQKYFCVFFVEIDKTLTTIVIEELQKQLQNCKRK